MQLDPLPKRPPDLMDTDWRDVFSRKQWAWVDGAQWMYAGASPVISVGCSCPTQRMHLDWYKRSFVPEAFRHSIGILDTNGNLVMHIGEYGNFDSCSGPKSRIPVGKGGLGMIVPRFVTGTDNYLAYHDWGERIVVLRLKYEAEETVPIP